MGCKMHDTMHDFVEYLNQNECFTMKPTITHGIETSSANDVTKPPLGDKVRHLTLMFAREGPFPSFISSFVNCEILRTFASFDSRITTIDSNLIRQLKRLRTLNLRDNHIEQLPEEIGDLMHLRNIDLSCNIFRLLPDSVCNLYNLQTLRLDRCKSLAKLPKNMGKLINLKHLHVEFCISMRYLPKGIGSIRNLRILNGHGSACFYCSEHAKSLTFGDLRTMNQLRRLAIFIVGIGEDAASKAEKAELRKKEQLSHLDLYFSGYDDDVGAGLMDALQPPENLESLEIGQYNGSTWPTWMTTSYLTKLTVFHLGYSRHSSALPPLGKLPSLKVIKLMSMDCLREIGREFFGVTDHTCSTSSSSSSSFPSLETLFLGNLSMFEKWELGREAEDSSNSQMSIMPRLSSLHIVECPKLKQLPDFLLQNVPLQNLLIDHCDSFGILPDEFISRITNVTIIQYGVDPFIRDRF
ncbi:hypothetical protein M0R45_027051 [Rubus argutus]|uniref:Disease resistance R13L4/SHOC-2-like LRR domain-containing protein n=1 Tax=Rubus argutus TaxID=59490 RepID=A0AAW1X0Q0_RUBAR